MAEPVFGTLRTKEQLGCSVHCSGDDPVLRVFLGFLFQGYVGS